MKTFDIFSNPTGQVEIVKQGFSWPGFFFSWIWGYIAKLWIPATVMLIVSLVLAPFYISFLVGFVSGFMGNDWRRSNLLQRGFNLVKSVEAESGEAAHSQFVAERTKENQENPQPLEEHSKDITDQLQDLKKLLDDGVLTDEEYENKRASLVAKL